MEYLKLLSDLILLLVFGWLLVKNTKRSGFIQGLLSIDIMLGLAASVYLIITSFIL